MNAFEYIFVSFSINYYRWLNRWSLVLFVSPLHALSNFCTLFIYPNSGYGMNFHKYVYFCNTIVMWLWYRLLDNSAIWRYTRWNVTIWSRQYMCTVWWLVHSRTVTSQPHCTVAILTAASVLLMSYHNLSEYIRLLPTSLRVSFQPYRGACRPDLIQAYQED